jgi:hypothetical protein
MRRRVTVALSRLTRILLLIAVALCLGAPTAGAVPAKKLDNNLEALWRTVLQTPTDENPLGPNGAEFGCVDLGGTVAPFGPVTTGVGSCKVKPGTKIFVAAFTIECSTFEAGHGMTEAELRACVRNPPQPPNQNPPLPLELTVTLDDTESVPVTLVETPLMHITLPKDNILGKPAGTEGLSVGAGWVALLHPLTPGTHTIEIDTAPDDDTNPTITTTIVVQPGLKP